VTIREYPIETQGVMSLDTAAVEFRAVAAHSRATNPYLHLVISWRDGEHPTNTQAFEAGRAALAAAAHATVPNPSEVLRFRAPLWPRVYFSALLPCGVFVLVA